MGQRRARMWGGGMPGLGAGRDERRRRAGTWGVGPSCRADGVEAGRAGPMGWRCAGPMGQRRARTRVAEEAGRADGAKAGRADGAEAGRADGAEACRADGHGGVPGCGQGRWY
jgi:hypothetical protein